ARLVATLPVVIGLGSIFARGQGIFDIDFAGGSSVQFRVDKPTETDTIRKIVSAVMVGEDGNPIQFTVNGVTMESSPNGTVYKVDSSFEKVDQLKDAISAAFAQEDTVNLVTYKIDISGGETKPPVAPNASSMNPPRAERLDNGTRL